MLQYYIEGMDCAGCVAKIEKALARLPGVSDVQLNLTTEKLTLMLAPEAATQSADIEKTIQSLGFGVKPIVSVPSTAAADSAHQLGTAAHWWQTEKGKLVIKLGIFLGGAYLITLLMPNYGAWVFNAAVIVAIYPFVKKSFALARAGTIFSIEMLMSIAAIGALLIGQSGEAAAVIYLFSIGELFESIAANHARAGISALANLMPKSAILLDVEGNQRNVAANSLEIDDLVLVRHGDKVPVDGVIVDGSASVDDSPITGESVPMVKTIGDKVFAGSINVSGVLQVRVEETAGNNTIARIIKMVEQAQASKAPIGRFIERFSRYYTPVVMLIAALIMIIPPILLQGQWETWLYRGLALLLIACPCALVLSTPAAIASALAVGARRGLLIKGGSALEAIGQVKTIAFDKTGTLSEGKPRVSDVIAFNQAETESNREDGMLALFASVESSSNHPLAKAIIDYAEAAQVPVPSATNVYTIAGEAVHATVAGRQLAVGSPVYVAKQVNIAAKYQAQIETLQNEGKTVSLLFDEQSSEILGLIALRDELREDAQEGVAKLTKMGIHCIMLTGDNRLTAQAHASNLGIAWQAELLPAEKLRLLNDMKANGRLAMVGDGINDAPALASADVGIAMGSGTDVALETADIALLQNKVSDVAQLVALSRATMSNIYQNVAFALGLKGIFLITTILGISGLWMAVLADAGATVLVTFNALRLLRFKDSY